MTKRSDKLLPACLLLFEGVREALSLSSLRSLDPLEVLDDLVHLLRRRMKHKLLPTRRNPKPGGGETSWPAEAEETPRAQTREASGRSRPAELRRQ